MSSCKSLHKAQYYETDQMGVVHHSNYIRWFEESRVEFMEQMGYPYKEMEAQGIISPVIGIEAKYHSMVRFEDKVYIEAALEKFNGIKMTISYIITDAATGELRTTGKSHHCFLAESGHPVALQKTHPAIYQLFSKVCS